MKNLICKYLIIIFFLIIALFIFPKFNTVNAEYIVEYVNLTQEVDLNYCPTNNTKVFVDFQFGWDNGKAAIITAGWDIRFHGFGQYPYFSAYWAGNNGGLSEVGYSRCNIEFDKNYFYYNGRLMKEFSNTLTFNSTQSFKLNTDSLSSNLKIYAVQIYENDVLVRDYMPALDNSSSEYGLYDNVNRNFISAGSNATGGNIVSIVNSLPLIDLDFSTSVSTNLLINTQIFDTSITDNYVVKMNFNNKWYDMFLMSDNYFSRVISENGYYEFAYFDKFTGEQIAGAPVTSLNVTNIVGTGSDIPLSPDVVIPIFDVSYTGTSDGSSKSATLKTQYFTYEEVNNLVLYYFTTLDDDSYLDDLSLWHSLPFYSENVNGTTMYYFSFYVTENCRVFSSFFDYSIGSYSYINYLDIDLDKLYEEYKPKDTPTLLQAILNTLNFLNPFSANFFGYKLVNLIVEGIGGLFIPNENFFEDTKNELLNDLEEKLPYEDYINIFSTIKEIDTGVDVEDIGLENYKVGDSTINVNSFIDFSIITKYRETWYSWVRGFCFIFLIIYHINQLTKFLRGFSISDGSITAAKGGKV